jgi:rod shape-determining protein MreC
MSSSKHTTDKMRGKTASFLAPFFEKIHGLKFLIPFHYSSGTSISEELQHLQIENQLLSTEITHLQQLLQEQHYLFSRFLELNAPVIDKVPRLINILDNVNQDTLQQLTRKLQTVPARVIFRSFDTWNHSIWIDKGESFNHNNPFTSIAKNSPVVVGNALIGIIDYVGEQQSRVRLLTDSRLTLSVRASRGGQQDFLLNENIEHLSYHLQYLQNMPLSIEEQNYLTKLLQKLKTSVQDSCYLAKGELNGSASLIRQGHSILLKGRGFNYDFDDRQGKKRELRTGKSTHDANAALPLLKVNDILVTTGMDGVFPAGLQVAIISKIESLKEGDYFYNLEAKPIISFLDGLSLVFILPPLEGIVEVK